jgi:hypothetical protein
MENPYSYFERFMAFTGSTTSDEVHSEMPKKRNDNAVDSSSGMKRDQGHRHWNASDVRRVPIKSPPAVHNNAEVFDSFEEVYIEDAPNHFQQAEPQLHHRHHPQQQHEGHQRFTEMRATTKHALHELGQSLTHSFSELAGRARSFGSISHKKGRGDEAPELTKSDSDGENTGTSTTDSSAELDDLENPRPVPIVETTTTKRGRSKTRQGRSEANSDRSSDRHGQEEHLSWLAYGFKWTVIGIIFSWLGFALAILARQNTSFATLETPLQVDPVFEPVVEVGMMNLKLCYNETYLGEEGDTGCMIHRLDSDEVNDAMFQVSRILLSMAILVGGFMSIFLTTASFWSSINLRPIGVGCLICYFLQSFSFLFFDTQLCAQYTCRVSTGCYFSIIASACWIMSCVAASRMEAFKMGQREKRYKVERRNRYKAKLAAAMEGMEIQEDHITHKSKSPEKQSRSNPKKTQSRTGSETRRAEGRSARAGFVVIEGIQDPKAHEAWLERQTEQVKHPVPRGGGAYIGSDIHIEVARPRRDPSLERRVTAFQANSSSWATDSLPVPHEKRRSSSSKKTRQPSASSKPNSSRSKSSRGRVRSEQDHDLNRSSRRRSESGSRSGVPAVVINIVDNTGVKKSKTERVSSSSDMKRSRTKAERTSSSSDMKRSTRK